MSLQGWEGGRGVPDFGVTAAPLSLCKREFEDLSGGWLGQSRGRGAPEKQQSPCPSSSFTLLAPGLC